MIFPVGVKKLQAQIKINWNGTHGYALKKRNKQQCESRRSLTNNQVNTQLQHKWEERDICKDLECSHCLTIRMAFSSAKKKSKNYFCIKRSSILKTIKKITVVLGHLINIIIFSFVRNCYLDWLTSFIDWIISKLPFVVHVVTCM